MLDLPPVAINPDNTKTRRCLSCAETFASEWAGERICKQCKQTSAWRSGVAHKRSKER